MSQSKSPQQNIPDVEQALEQSTRTQRVLSDERKDALLARVMEAAATETAESAASHLEQQANLVNATGSRRRWEEVLHQHMTRIQWLFVGGAAVAAFGFIAFNAQNVDLDGGNLQIARVERSAAIGAGATGIPANDTETTEETDVAGEEDGKEDVEEDVEEAAQFPAISNTVHAGNLAQRIGGFGGGVANDFGLWQISVHPLASEFITDRAVGELQEYPVFRLSEQRMRELAALFPSNGNDLRLTTEENYDIALVTNIPESHEEDYLIYECKDSGFAWEIAFDGRCVDVTEFGDIHFEQEVGVAQADGLAEASAYVAAITGTTTESLRVSSIESTQLYEEVRFKGTLTEYIITPLGESLDSGTDYIPASWHVVLEDGRLVWLEGSIAQPQTEEPSAAYTIASASEAVARMREDYRRLGNDEPLLYTYNALDPFGNLLTPEQLGISDEEVELGIYSVTLEYRPLELFIATEESRNSTYQLRVAPLYRIAGLEMTTNTPFEVMVDGTDSSVYFSKLYTIIR